MNIQNIQGATNTGTPVSQPNAGRYHSTTIAGRYHFDSTTVDLVLQHSYWLDISIRHIRSYERTSAALTNARCCYLSHTTTRRNVSSRYHSCLTMTLETSVGQPLLIAAFIDCSPLGLYCRDCEVAFISNKSAEQHIRTIHRDVMN